MKQRITVEQLNELTEEQKEKLREWWKPQDGDFFARRRYHVPDDSPIDEYCIGGLEFVDSGGADTFHAEDGDIPLLSIGQMIELIKEHDAIRYCNLMVTLHTPLIVIPHNAKDQKYADIVTEMLKQIELIDALWDAVKQAL